MFCTYSMAFAGPWNSLSPYVIRNLVTSMGTVTRSGFPFGLLTLLTSVTASLAFATLRCIRGILILYSPCSSAVLCPVFSSGSSWHLPHSEVGLAQGFHSLGFFCISVQCDLSTFISFSSCSMFLTTLETNSSKLDPGFSAMPAIHMLPCHIRPSMSSQPVTRSVDI